MGYEMEPQQSTVKVHDLGLAAALVCRGVEISNIVKGEKGRAYFIFCYGSELDADINVAIDNYWYNHLEVDARQFADNIKMLKSRIYSER